MPEERARTSFGTRNPSFFDIGPIRVQAEKATPMEDRTDWYELQDEKRAEITFFCDPGLRGDNPVVRVNYGSRTGEIDCCKSIVSAMCVYVSVLQAASLLLGEDATHLLRPAAVATDDKVRFASSDPHQLVRLIKRMKEEGGIEAMNVSAR